MRLIDAELFKKQVEAMTIRNGYIPEKANALCELIDSQPTAFDVEKVIEQIEYRRANFDCKLCKYNDDEKTICSEDCSDALIDGLIEIVKGGGVE